MRALSRHIATALRTAPPRPVMERAKIHVVDTLVIKPRAGCLLDAPRNFENMPDVRALRRLYSV